MEEYEIITLDLPRDVLFNLMMKAHKEDVTLNEYMNKVIMDYIKIHTNVLDMIDSA